jgi:hypothetical protein
MKLPNGGHDLGPIVISTVKQAGAAPILDGGVMQTDRGRVLDALTVLPPWLWLTPRAERRSARSLSIGMIGRPGRWAFLYAGRPDRFKDDLAAALARRLPRRVRLWAVVDAAVRATEPAMRSGGYCGPDGVTFKDMHDAVAKV